MKKMLRQCPLPLGYAILTLALFAGCSDETESKGGGDSGFPLTTLEETIVPLVPAEPQSSNDRSDWGHTKIGLGEPFAIRNDLGTNQASQSPGGEFSSLGLFWHLTDIHIIDEESPARLIRGDQLVSTAYRNQEAWSPLALDATIRTGNSFSEVYPFDFVLVTGDLVDNIHRNELEWFMAIMEGGTVDPDSGDDDDPLPGSNLDPHSPFEAAGLSSMIPWYVATGNHDEMIMGFLNDTMDGQVADPTGDTTSDVSAAVVPTCLDDPWHDSDPKSPKRCYMPPRSYFDSSYVVPDPNREFVRDRDFLEPFFNTRTIPNGHGLTEQNLEQGHTYYTVDGILPNVPSTLVVLDTTSRNLEGGDVDATQLEWLQNVLDQAEASGRIVIVASHHPARVFDETEDAFVATLHGHANVVLHIAGHSHRNVVTPRPAPDGLTAEYGYWEIETSSLIDWPQQTRLVEIVDNRNGTGSIYATMLNYQIPSDRPALKGSRFYALYDVQEGYGELDTEGDPVDRNAILQFTWPENIASALAANPSRPVQSTQFQSDPLPLE